MTDTTFWCLTAVAEAALLAIGYAYVQTLRDKLKRFSAMDLDGDGRPGGSRKRA